MHLEFRVCFFFSTSPYLILYNNVEVLWSLCGCCFSMGVGFLTSRRAKGYDEMDSLYYEQYCVNV